MTKPKNILFIMCDQLRHDYLGCYGHPTLKTPNIDKLAARGVRFTKAYVQSTICGPSRMSAYTGRYVRSHGSTQNGVPLRVGEPTLGDHLKEIGVRNVLVGKTHMVADVEGMKRLGIDQQSIIGVHVAQCGFEPHERDDGLHPSSKYDPNPRYDDYLREQGFDGDNPWEQWANSGEDADGALLNGWLLSHADKPARIPEEHSETPYMTRRAMDFMREAKTDGRPWCLHLSYIKPHWPYIVPAPYHNMYGAADVMGPVRSENERAAPHPLYQAFMDERFSKAFSRDEVRQRVIPAYMGLIKQIDDQMGVLFSFMEELELMENTMIVFTSDHGDYLGDHWLGEKYLFHDVSSRVPLIIYDPSRDADVTRGTTCDALVEMIDLAPTFLDYCGGTPKPHILEGRSLLPVLHGAATEDWRTVAISEYDYSMDLARINLEVAIPDARLYMVTDGRWKYIHADGFRPMLYDLLNDPDELVDHGDDPACAEIRAHLYEAFAKWSRTTRTQITMSDADIQSSDEAFKNYDINIGPGILIGYWDEAEVKREHAKRAAYLKSLKVKD
jgi:arylsulfatase A-like enzyme